MSSCRTVVRGIHLYTILWRGNPGALTASATLHAVPSIRIKRSPCHSASGPPIGDDGPGFGEVATAEGRRIGVRVMKAARRRSIGPNNFHFENRKTKATQAREQE